MVSNEETKKIANLAKLYISDSETEILTKELNNIISFANEINEVEMKTETFANANSLENVLRKDEIKKSFDRELILKNANEQENGFFVLRYRT